MNGPGHHRCIEASKKCKENEVWTSEGACLPLHPQTSHHWPPSSSLPTHYPCQTGPGPTWHSLVDLIELDIPSRLGIVWWHENLPAIPVKAGEKRGIGNTCRHIWGLEVLRDGKVLARWRLTSLPLCPSSVPGAEWDLSRGVISFNSKLWQSTSWKSLGKFTGIHLHSLCGKSVWQ